MLRPNVVKAPVFNNQDLEVRKWLTPNKETLSKSTTLKEASEFLIKYERNEAVVCQAGKIVGMITLSKIIQALMNGIHFTNSIETLMDREVKSIRIDASVTEVIGLPHPQIPVVDENGIYAGTLFQTKIIEGYTAWLPQIQSLENTIEWFKICFDTAYEGICVVDEQGIIRMFNEAYSRFVGVKKEEAIGRHATEVIENTRLPVVLQTGIPEKNQAHQLQGQDMIVHRIPIWKNNQVIGAIGMLIFEGVSELYKIFDRVQDLHRKKRKQSVVFKMPSSVDQHVTFDQIIGESKKIADAKKTARRAAKTTASILISGASGVGKELFAKAIHSLSPFSGGPMVTLNCASVPESLLESELFGYEEGAFTGSKRNGKPGKFELAHQGTLFLDEIADMSLRMQSKILRAIQEREIERVGGRTGRPVNFRLIAATNRSLEEMVQEGTFREDLYYRINVIPIHIPTLSERKSDIPQLLSYQLQKTCQLYQQPLKEIDKEAMQVFIQYDWPGNIRELVNIVERLVTLVDGDRIYAKDLPDYFFNKQAIDKKTDQINVPDENEGSSLLTAAKNISLQRQKEMILRALTEAEGNKSKAAEILGISRGTLYNRLSKLNLRSN